MDCIFCKLINRQFPVDPIFEDENYIVLKDRYPKAPTHLLIIPKKHIETINDLEDSDSLLVGGMFLLARDLAKKFTIGGYKLHFNVGKEGGQEVFHIHLHLMSNQNLV